MKIDVSPFHGELPKLASKMLPAPHATSAINCNLESMSLKPARGTELVTTLGAAMQSIYRHNTGVWFRWSEAGVSAVKSPLNNDVHDRVYWTGDGVPRMTTYALATSGASVPAASYRLGIPAPATALTASDAPGEPDEGGVLIDTVYTYTYVSEFGEEGPPAAASAMVSRFDGATNELSGLDNPPTGDRAIITKRIYRAETGGVFLFVADIPAAQSTFSDSVPTESLGQPLPSINWDEPDARMKGLTNIGNGVLCGWFDNTLCFCEPFRPHAWPVGYQMGFDADIVGVSPFSGGLIVVTKSRPWLVTGITPASMAQMGLDVHLGGVSRHSVVDMGEYAIYASNEGLVAVGGNQSNVITKDMISREQWQAFNPDSIHAYRWHDRYLAFYKDDTNTWRGFLLHPEHGLIRMSVGNVPNGYFDPLSGQVFLLSANGEIQAWDAGSALPYTWRSKVFTLPQRASMSVAKIDSDAPVSMRIWSDDVLLLDTVAEPDTAFRLPPGRYRDWQFELTGTAEVLAVQIASSPRELL
ncbi:hypothetical protein NFC81_09070 [Salinispirillum sp. LH 10-3-1]|uniref:Uncharacterized protein n=1 Tax=Salinispirillum sp. LH 10-3-1 TaxID=2952525 RepID=A0AB38YCS6_9GAMM